ncbi:MAG TPA: hypothetical protein VGD81_18795 [Opitutaceae bacterium]
MIRLVLLFLLISGALHAAGSAEVQDLGQGLGYLRIKEVDTLTLPSAATRPLVIDLRHASLATPAAAAKLRPLLSAEGPPRFVLVSATTPPPLLALLDARAPTVLTLGTASPTLTPDIAVATTPEADQLAYEAVEQGAPVAAVVARRLEKERYDEAAMTRDHANGVPVPDSPPAPDDAAPTPAPAESPPASPAPAGGDEQPKPPPAPPVDAVLQRAVQVYQALKALRKA